jgi:hypothetical protein
MLRRVFWQKLTYVLEETLMMEAERTSETSVNIYHTTGFNIPEGSHLHVSFASRVLQLQH